MSRPSKDEGMESNLTLSAPRPGAGILDVEQLDAEEDDIYPTHPWFRFRLAIREYVAEFLGVCILVVFGAGVDCQVVLASNPSVSSAERGSWLSLNLGWAVGTAMGVWVSGGISGGHVNPAVTLMLATFRGFPWSKVPGYIFAQVLGGVTGAALAYANYIHAIDIFEGGRNVRTLATAGLFSTYAASYMTSVSAFFSEVLATAVLCIMVLAINDKNNAPPPPGLAPLVIFLILLGIGASLGMETGYAINPARDLGPRILTAMVGYGSQVFTFRDQYWIWCPVLGPIVGAQAAAVFYDLFLYTGEDSPFNKPRATARQKRGQVADSHYVERRRSGRNSTPVFHLTVP